MGGDRRQGMDLRHILKYSERFSVRKGRGVHRKRGVGRKGRFGGDRKSLFRQETLRQLWEEAGGC